MKKIYFILLLLISSSLFSQYTSTGIGRWRLGLNVGGTWQTANINSKLFDVGYGATLEYAVHEDYDSFFGFSLRGRFLRGQTKGYNKQREYGSISNNNINGISDTIYDYSSLPIHLNNRTIYNEFSLEAMLKWNRLYQNHGIVFYLYMAGGFTHYKVETNQQDEFGFMYDYSTIPQSTSNTVDELKFLLDNSYETELAHPNYNSLVFTPSIGVGFGFRVARGFDIVWEHKTSLPQTDLFEGQIHESDDPSFVKDIYHYSSLGFIFNIIGHNDPTAYTPPVEPTGPTTPTTPITTTPTKPVITLTKPTTNTFNPPNCKVKIEAKIENVNSQNDIEFYHNGNKIPSYKYFFAAPTFKSTIDLSEGNNTFKIIAKNASYSDTKTFSLTCNNNTTVEICHKDNNGKTSTIIIKETDWSVHQSHGDSKGKCPEPQITICHNVPGQAGKTQTINIPESEWAIHQSHGDYLGECNIKKMITVCHQNKEITIDEKDWATHASHGDTKGSCPPPVNMINICHIPPTGNKRVSMTIPENEWVMHQAHGDFKGTCPPTEPTIEICHKNPNGTKTNMTIPEFRWNEHFSHGDAKGKCPEVSFTICHTDPTTKKKQNISITESLWATHAAHGDTKGTCPVADKNITICHNIPGQPGKTQTISIPESQWLIHKSHGDKLGICFNMPNDKLIQICHKNSDGTKTPITIKESEWATHGAHGDTKGKCPIVVDKRIAICHNVPGKPGVTKTISISESQWLIHKSHGDKLGECDNVRTVKVKVCHQNTTLTIDESELAAHLAHGDVIGTCKEKMIDICHKNGNQLVNMTIKESDWAVHQAHGDKIGSCPDESEFIEICHMTDAGGVQKTIHISKWPAHKAHGDTKGKCVEDKKIEICHKTANGTYSDITILESQWATHQAHGDIKGKCKKDTTNTGVNLGGGKITICHYPPGNKSNPQTIEIPASAWPAHKAHGDVLGTCGSSKKSKGKVRKTINGGRK